MDANILHTSYEGGVLENPWNEPEEKMWLRTKSLNSTPNKSEYITLEFINGDAVKLNNKKMSPAKIFEKLNILFVCNRKIIR